MSRVASEPNFAQPLPSSAGSRRPRPDAADKSNPFDALLEGSGEPVPPPRKNAPPERTQPGSTARTRGTARDEPARIASGKPPKAGAEQAAGCADPQPTAAADAVLEDAGAKVEDCPVTAEGCPADEKAADATPIEAALLSAAGDDSAAPPPVVIAQPIAAPLAATSLLDAQAANAAAADGEACAAVDGKGSAAAAGKDIAAADGRALAAAVADGTRARGAADPKAGPGGKAASADASASKDSNGSKPAGAADPARSEAVAVAAIGAEQGDGEGHPDTKAKSDQLQPPAAAAGNNDAPPKKPGESLSQQRGEDRPAVDGGKPPVDAAQIARAAHSGDQFGTVVAHAAQAAATAPFAAAKTPGDVSVPIAGIAIEIAAKAQTGRNRFEIRLDPPELGRIDVRLDIDRSGHVTSRLMVEKAETLDLLRRDAAELERALQQAGLKTSDNGLQFTLRDQAFAGRDQGQPAPNAARLAVADADLAPIETAGGYARSPGRDGGIDIRV